MTKGIGQPVRRKEDARLVIGAGCFSDDVDLPRQTRAFVLRSVHAHARIKGIDTTRAKALKGVLAVLTGADLKADGIKPIPPDASITVPVEAQRKLPDVVLVNKNGPYQPTPYNILAVDKVRYVGEGVVLVVAETLAIAKDAAELVEIDYEALPAVTDTSAAAEPGAARLYDDARSNLFCEAEVGDAAATEAAFARAAHVVRLETWVQRVTGVPMEARTAVGHYDKQSGRYFLHAGSGGVVRQKGECAAILGVPAESVQVVARDIGGNFGTKNSLFPEFPLVLWASKRIGRPVKWTCERSEAFLSDYQGRDLVAKVELAVDAKGKFLAIRGSHLSNIGGYAASIVPLRKGLTHLHQRLSHPGRALSGVRGAQQYHVHDPLSQRRPPRGGLPDGAAVRSRRRQDRHRPHRHPPPQPDLAEGAAVSHRARHQIRQRRIRSRRWTSPFRSPIGRSSPSAAANRARPASCAASGSPTTSNAPWAIRASGRRSR